MPAPHIVVIEYERHRRPDSLLATVVQRLQERGLRVGGLLQDGQVSDGSGCATLFLTDIGTSRRVQIFQRRGVQTRGCRLDPSGLADAAIWLREAIQSRPNVLFVNRFGRQEAAGQGLLSEIAEAVLADIPVVVPVAKALRPDWDEFIGGDSDVLGDADAVVAWCLAQTSGDVAEPSSRSLHLHRTSCAAD